MILKEITIANNKDIKLIQINKNCIEIVAKILKSKLELDLKFLKEKNKSTNDVIKAKIKE